MATVTTRINQIKQPRGGFVPVSKFEKIQLDDGKILNAKENISPSIIGTVVEYLARNETGADNEDAFAISLLGARNCGRYYNKTAQVMNEAIDLLNSIKKGLDDQSIINACKLASFDVWYRNLPYAISMNISNISNEINPNKETVENIKIMVERGKKFLKNYGPVKLSGFNFLPYGYSKVVDAGDGDFLTKDTLWDFKTIKSNITSKHTLQIMMYYLMGKRSGQIIFDDIKNIGIFNPRKNEIYLLNTNTISKETIEIIEKDIICY